MRERWAGRVRHGAKPHTPNTRRGTASTSSVDSCPALRGIKSPINQRANAGRTEGPEQTTYCPGTDRDQGKLLRQFYELSAGYELGVHGS